MTRGRRISIWVGVVVLAGSACGKGGRGSRTDPEASLVPRGAAPIALTSTDFADKGEIPSKQTCEGGDVSPALAWSNLPGGTKSLVLFVDDPDAPDPAAPKVTWVHWVLYDMPPTANGLPEHVGAADLPAGTRQGLNGWVAVGYRGPCPPIGRHRYFFKLYALDSTLGDLGKATKAKVVEAMKGHVLGKGELVGTYEKHGG